MDRKNRENTVGIVGVIAEAPKLILKAPDWSKEVYETKIEVPRKSEDKDTLIVQFAAALAGTKKQLAAFKKGAEVIVGGRIRTKNEHERTPTKPSVKIYIEAEIMALNNPPADQQNDVLIKGNICKDPELRQTSKGIHIITIIVAVSNGHSKADFIPCVCWGEIADAAANLKKRSYVEVRGRMQSRDFKKYMSDVPILMTAYEVAVSQLGIDIEDICITKKQRTRKRTRTKGRKANENDGMVEKGQKGSITGRSSERNVEDDRQGRESRGIDQSRSEDHTDAAPGSSCDRNGAGECKECE